MTWFHGNDECEVEFYNIDNNPIWNAKVGPAAKRAVLGADKTAGDVTFKKGTTVFCDKVV